MIKDLHQELIDKIPGINNAVRRGANKFEYMSWRNFDIRLKRIEKYNLRKYGRSLTASSLKHYFSFCVLEIQTDNQVLIINRLQYKLIAEYLKSERFNTIAQ